MFKDMLRGVSRFVAPTWTAALEERLWLSKQARLLRERLAHAKDMESKLDVLLASPWFSPDQQKPEILSLLRLLSDRKPGLLCEIGAAKGGTLCLFQHVAAPAARILSIDIAYTPARLQAVRRLVQDPSNATFLTADSHAQDTLKATERWLQGDQLDFLFIDGDHTLAGVKSDYDMYSPLVRKGGIIAFHDINPDFRTRFGKTDSTNDTGEVPVFWADLKRQQSQTLEFVADPAQDGFGIGVVLT